MKAQKTIEFVTKTIEYLEALTKDIKGNALYLGSPQKASGYASQLAAIATEFSAFLEAVSQMNHDEVQRKRKSTELAIEQCSSWLNGNCQLQ